MRHIEEAAKPTVTRLMQGDTFLLDTLSQRSLAAFLCLVSMRLEMSGEMRSIPPSDIDQLKNRWWPGPSRWWIAIARYHDEKDPHDYWFGYWGIRRTSLLDPRPIGPKDCNTHVSTIIAGKMCAHVFSSTVWNDFRGYEGATLCQIWPASQFCINTGSLTFIDNDGLPWLHEAIARDGNPPESNK